MTVNTLFFKRLMNSWKHQFQVWKMVIDWTVALYIVIPLIAVAIYHYINLWKQPPSWIEFLPMMTVYLFFFLNASFGNLRFYLEEGDQLFLRQQATWISGLKKRGVGYSLLSSALTTGLFTAALSPIVLLHFNWPVIQLVACALFSFICKHIVIVCKQFIELRFFKIKRLFCLLLFYSGFAIFFFSIVLKLAHNPLILVTVCVLLLYLLMQLMRMRVWDQGHFMMDVQREQKVKDVSLSFVMGQAGVVKKTSWFTPSSPLIFRKSTRIFKKRTAVNIVAVLCFKTIFRKWTLVKLYIQYVVVISVAIIVTPPLWLKGILWIVGFILLLYWLKSYWRDMQTSSFVKLFKWEYRVMLEAGNKATLMLAIVAYSVISLISGLLMIIL